MGLDCIPRPYDKDGRPIQGFSGLTHSEGDPCPFDTDKFPIGMLGTCCSLRGKCAAHELAALGQDALAERMYEDMSPSEATSFALELRAVADELERRTAAVTEKPRGAGWNGTWDDTRKEWDWQSYSTFEEALASIREAARWYEKVGTLGYGVYAWS